MGLNIGSVFLALLADDSKLAPQVVTAAEKAGDAGAKTLGAKLAGGLKTVGFKAFAAAASGAFAIAAAGAAKLEDVQARIRAETGAGADEAKAAAKAINKAAGDEQASLDDVADVAVRVRRDLGATGDEADQLTARFTRFARVTRQNAGGAVSDFDNILDAWNLTADKSGAIQDVLIAGWQKWGGDITANQKALAAFAPQLKAMNATWEDGAALINLFNASGLDAEAQVRALNTAVKNLKPGQGLQDLFDQISAIQDPTERAQKAIEIFGARGGVGLANALAPGRGALDDFKVKTEDATGAVDEAADALDSTFGGSFRKLMSQAGAAIRGFGADFGIALSSLGSLGSLATALGLDRVLAKGFGALKKSGVVKAAAQGAGSVIGGIFDVAFAAAGSLGQSLADGLLKVPGVRRITDAAQSAGAAVGSKFALGFLSALAAVGILDALIPKDQDKIAAQFGKDFIDSLTAGTLDEAKAKRAELAKAIEQLQVVPQGLDPLRPFRTLFGSDDATNQLKGLLADADRIIAAWAPNIQAAAGQLNAAAARGLTGPTSGPASFATAARTLARELPLRLLEAGQATREAAAQLPSAIADGIRARRDAAKNAFDNLVELLKHPLSRAQELGRLIGYATSGALIKALKSKDPEVKNAAKASQATWLSEIEELVKEGGKPGEKALAKLEKALKSKDPQLRAAAQAAKKVIDGGLKDDTGAKTPGEAITQDLAKDIRDGGDVVGKEANSLGRRIARELVRGLHGEAPAAPTTPHTPAAQQGGFTDKGGQNFAQGTMSVPYTGTFGLHKAEIVVPRAGSDAIRSGAAVLSSGGVAGGVTIQNLTVDASGHADPAAAAAAVQRAIEDGMASALRNQGLRYAGSTRR
jgi:hypothetical protein